MMKGILIKAFGPPSVCKVADIAIPKLGARQVLIKTKFAGLNPVDTYIRSGVYPKKPELPYTPGKDCSGIVEMVGEGVTEFSPGDPVFTAMNGSGSCAEYVAVDASYTFPLNLERLTFQQGACLGTPYFTTYRALITRGLAKSGQSVLIHGASGGVGTLCVQMAKYLGMTVYATAGSEKGLELVKTCGADFVYNHRDEKHCEQIMEDTKGVGVDLIIEMLANVNLQSDLEMMSCGGRTVVVGNRGSIEINPRLLMAKESCVMGCVLFNTSPEEWEEMSAACINHQQLDWLRPIVGKEYTLDQVPQAHEDIINTTSAAGNLVINTTATSQ